MSKRTSPCNRHGAQAPSVKALRGGALALAVAAGALLPFSALPQTDLSTVPLPTFTVGSTVDIKPNILLVLDDSGSMDWDYLPDWANDQPNNYSAPTTGSTGSDSSNSGTHATVGLPQYLYFNSAFNGVAYNPAINYSPPSTFNSSGQLDPTKYPSMTASATTNWTKVLNDGYKVQDTGTSSLVDNRNAYFYTTQPGEYCDSPALTNCQTSSVPSGKFAYPAPLRWCSDQQLTTCRGLQSSTFKYPRMAAPRMATLSISSVNSGAQITQITVDGKQILSATATTGFGGSSGLADSVATNINACRYSLPSGTNCTIVGYIAVSNGSSVNIYAPGVPTSTVPTVASSAVTSTITKFDRAPIPLPDWFNNTFGRSRSNAAVPGENLRTVLTSTTTSYPYPGNTTKAASRTDCAGTTCTFAEEMTNYANWWAYYRTRMQMMKTASSRAFGALDKPEDIAAGKTRYRVGYLTINNNTTKDFVNVKDFDPTQKVTWFTQLFKANPGNNTPLRSALATAGQLYGGTMNGDTFRGTTVTDPLQFSCQKNYTILSTDGYWNTNNTAPNGGVGSKLDGSTMVANQDGPFARPYNDGATTQAQQRTSQLQQRLDSLSAQKGTLQKQISQLQISTSQLQSQVAQPQQINFAVQTQTAQLMASTSVLQTATGQLQKQDWKLQQTDWQMQKSTDGGVTWSNVTGNNAGCNPSSSIRCQYVVKNGFPKNVGSCTPVAKSTGTGNWTTQVATDCAYAGQGWVNGACTWKNMDTVNWSVGTATTCQYVWPTPTTATSCTADPPTTSTANNTAYKASPIQCTYSTPTTPGPVASCTYKNPSVGPTNFNVATATYCSYGSWSTATASGSCTVSSQTTATADGTSYNPAPAQCSYGAGSTPSTVGSCTVVSPTTATANGTVYRPVATSCQYASYSTFANTGSCTQTAKNTSTTDGAVYSPATNCQYTAFSGFSDATSCTATPQSTGPNYTVGTASNCQYRVSTAFQNATSCTPTTAPDATGKTTQCQYTFAAAATTLSCSPVYTPGDFTNATVYQNCTRIAGNWLNATSCNVTSTPDANGKVSACQYTAWGNWQNVGSCTPVPQSASPTYTVGVAKECQTVATGGTSDTLADVAAYYYNTDLRDASQVAPNATGPCAAASGNDLCNNNVAAVGRDVNPKQHMTTHTLGLGATGMMVFSPYQNDSSGNRVYVPDYWQQPSGDFYDVANGSIANPTSGICPWQTAGTTCTWPIPASDSPANIDDLWHAAVNGHGTYFSAGDPAALAAALTNVLSQITNTPRPGTAAAAASSNPNITSSDNFVFSSSYLSVDWVGELIMQRFNADGSLTAEQWSASRLLDCALTPWQAGRQYVVGDVYNQSGVCYLVTNPYTAGTAYSSSLDASNARVLSGTPVTRTIYTVGSTGLTPFTWANLNSTQQSYFSMPWIGGTGSGTVSPSGTLTQFCTVGSTCMGTSAQTAAAGQPLVSFLAGDRTNEGTFFRARPHILGDIVSSEARYLKAPISVYLDPGYSAFKTANADRAATVFVGSNDGMLHAFNGLTGEERWAFIPTAVLPELYHLADMNYSAQHRYFVDGSPEVGDICPKAPPFTCAGSEWKTVLVGGMNQGGKSYYALDVTDPTTPTLLWEFSDSNLGYSYSNPRFGKLKNGTWVVMIASGYNNADGKGHLYVLNAYTGALISNTVANDSNATPTNQAGVARIASRAPLSPQNATIEEVYGGDLLGNVWRFDPNGSAAVPDIGATGIDATLLITLKDGSIPPKRQPITAKPVVTTVNDKPLVIVGTGRYLGVSDLNDTSVQSMYGIKDMLTSVTMADPRSTTGGFVQQAQTDSTCPNNAPATLCTQGQVVRTSTSTTVDWSVKNGWYVDFPVAGERSVTDPQLALGTLVFNTLKPQTATATQVQDCTGDDSTINAKSYQYWLDYLTGGAVEGTKNVAGIELCTCIATRPSLVRTQNGELEAITRVTGGGGVTSGSGGSSGGADAGGSGGGGGGGSGKCVAGETDMAGTKCTTPPTPPDKMPARRLSWRELNGE